MHPVKSAPVHRCCRSVSQIEVVAEIGDGLLQPVLQLDLGCPAEGFAGEGDVGLALARIALDDLLRLVPLAFALVLALLVYMMRTWVGALATAAAAAAGVIATLGIAGWAGVVLTAGTAISPLSVVVLIAASCIHLMLSWMRALDERGDGAAGGRAAGEREQEQLLLDAGRTGGKIFVRRKKKGTARGEGSACARALSLVLYDFFVG